MVVENRFEDPGPGLSQGPDEIFFGDESQWSVGAGKSGFSSALAQHAVEQDQQAGFPASGALWRFGDELLEPAGAAPGCSCDDQGGDKATTSGSSGSVDLAPSILGAWAMT